MSDPTIQELLALVENPSRYLGSEVNTVRKDPAEVDLRIALAFPDLYEIGTSHFGIQILYDLLNRREGVAAERVFAPAQDMADLLRSRSLPLTSLESATPLDRFDIVGFSLLYELNYTNVLAMLDLGRIPLYGRDRGEGAPFVIGGGPCTCNPEPVAPFFDALVFGDGEGVVPDMVDRWGEWRRAGGRRTDLLRAWSRIPGVYIPSFFTERYDGDGFQHLAPRFDDLRRVKRAVVGDLDATPFPERPVVPFGRPVHDRLRIELSRGCTRGCRFCQAGMLYRPVRERSPEKVLDLCETAIRATGYEDVSLLSLSTGDYRCLAPLLEAMMTRYACDHVAVSLPSVRAGVLTPTLMKLIQTVRKTGFTIAPEAGSQRLRDVINKNVTEEQIRDTVTGAFGMGWNLIKLYFMVGLPTETREDLEAMVALVDSLRRIRGPGGRFGKVNVSVATFIPKPHTPFQWAAQETLEASREKIEWLRGRLRMPGVQVKWQNPEMSYLEGLMARGDRRMAAVIHAAYRSGCRFDGWSDHFRFDRWREAIGSVGLDPAFFLDRSRDPGEPLPWDHMDSRVEKAYLIEEWQSARRGDATGDCRDGACNDCGACDFDTVEPRVFQDLREAAPVRTDTPPRRYRKVDIGFSKLGAAKHFGHLELVNVFTRAFRRSGLPLKYSEGFHPKPRMVFRDALPIGVESLCESVRVELDHRFPMEEIARRLDRELPEGLRVTGCRPAPPAAAGDRVSVYRVGVEAGAVDTEAIRRFQAAAGFPVERRGKKGKVRTVDLKPLVRSIRAIDERTLEIEIWEREGVRLRPGELLTCLGAMDPQDVRKAGVIRIGSIPVPRAGEDASAGRGKAGARFDEESGST